MTLFIANFLFNSLTIGAAVRLHGSWSPSRGRGQSHELQVERATVLGPSDAKVRSSSQLPSHAFHVYIV